MDSFGSSTAEAGNQETWAVFHGFSLPTKPLISILTFYKIEDFFNALLCTQHKNTSTKYIPELLQDAPASELVAKLNSLDAADGKHLFCLFFSTSPKLEAERGREGGSPVYSKKRATHSASWNLLVKTHGNIPPGKKKKIKKRKKRKEKPNSGNSFNPNQVLAALRASSAWGGGGAGGTRRCTPWSSPLISNQEAK